MYHPVSEGVLYCALKLVVTFEEWSGGKQHSGTGTGFLVFRDGNAFLITNRHVIDAGYQSISKKNWAIVSIKVSGYDKHQQYFEGFVEFSDIRRSENWDEDIACIKANQLVVHGNDPTTLEANGISFDLLASSETINKLTASHFIVFPGYPKWHDINSSRPILRSGIISSYPRSDYCGPRMTPGSRRILIEAFSSEGMSGSPVFALSYGVNLGSGLSGMSFFPGCVIGINVGHYDTETRTENREFNESGMSFVIKSTAIADLINQLSIGQEQA
jgi:hypothetical protein